MARSLLLVCRRAPWSGMAAREALDIALAGGAFDLPISLLFLDEGVWQLAAGQQAAPLEQKNLLANLQALPLFGVENIYAARADAEVRGLALQDSALPLIALENSELAALYAQHDWVVTL